MTTMTTPRQTEDEPQVAKTKPTYGYYRQPNGWITASPATDLEELKYRREGWEPLTRYGRFEMSTPWSANNPLEVLFMLGGAGELCVEQIVQQGLYLDPPKVPTCREPLGQNHKRHVATCLRNARPVRFPQLQDVTVELGPFPCKVCAERVFPTEASRDQHTAVMHAAEKSDERTGQSLAEALVKGLGGSAPATTVTAPAVASFVAEPALIAPVFDLVTEMREQMEAMRRELAALKADKVALVADAPGDGQVYVSTCADCGQVFRSFTNQRYANQALGVHRKTKHPKA